MKKRMSNIILIIIFVAGLSLLLYPTVSDYWNSFHSTQAIAKYSDIANTMEEEKYNKLLNDAYEYNKKLLTKYNRYELTPQEIEEYNSLLNITGDGMMGYVEIPVISVKIPIYHGTSEPVLAIGAGHIENTSLPVGGKGNHCVLSGHRGLPSARLFTDLDMIVEGDIFIITVLNETLTYQVDQIRIVEPQNINDLGFDSGQDYCTLVTCTPYGVNSHRMLVRGHRIKTEEANNIQVKSDAIQIEPVIIAPIVAAPILLVLLILLLVKTRKKKKNTTTNINFDI